MTQLTITTDDVLKTARLDPANAVDLSDANFVIAKEQAAIEARLRESALADLSLAPLLTRNVTKLLAAEVLEMRSREDGASGTFQGAGITLGQPLDHPARLRAEAYDVLIPFLRTGAEAVSAGPTVSLSSFAVQDRLFGPTEAARQTTEVDA